MPKCDFNKVASNFIETTLWHGYSAVNLLHIFRTLFAKNTSGWLLLYNTVFRIYNHGLSFSTASIMITFSTSIPSRYLLVHS